MEEPVGVTGEWHEEERVVPVLEFEPELDQFGNIKGMTHKVAEKTVKERYTYASLTPHSIRKEEDHYFEIRNGGKRLNGRVIVQCRHCSIGRDFVVGVHCLEDGRIVRSQS